MSKKSKSTSTNAPSRYSQAYITPAANALQSAYQSSMPRAQQISDSIYSQLPGLQQQAFGENPMLEAAQGYVTDAASGKYLDEGNPYLGGMIDQTNNSITDRVQSTFSKAGRTGSGANTYTLGKALGENENQLRYGNYAAERQAQAQAASMAPSLTAAQYSGLGAYLTAAQAAAGIPMNVAQQYAGGTGSLVGQYNTQTQTSQQPVLGSILGAGLSGWASGGFGGI